MKACIYTSKFNHVIKAHACLVEVLHLLRGLANLTRVCGYAG
jgi:hypothetical protein